MHSPLPDASALEAGIIEDSNPSRLSRVQDNVRHLLRNSRFASPVSTPPATPTRDPARNHGISTPPLSPYLRTSPDRQPGVAFAESVPSTASITPTGAQGQEIPGVLFPPLAYQSAVQQMARRSALFNTRAVAALDHPDLMDPPALALAKQKAFARQRKAWKRSRNGSPRSLAVGGTSTVVQVGSSQCVLCVLAALLLAATVATCSPTICPDVQSFVR